MSDKILYIFGESKIDVEKIGGGIFSVAQSIAKRMNLLLSLVEESRIPNKKTGFVRIVRPRTVKRTMLGIDKRCGKLEEKIRELRSNPEKFRNIISITLKLIMIKIQHKPPEALVANENIENIINTSPENFEIEAIIALLENYGFTRKEIFETIRGDTAKKIKKIEFDDVYTFLKKITQNPL